MGNLYNTIQAWVTRPWTTPLDTVQIFLLMGLLIIFFIVWARIIAHLQEVI